MCNKIITSKGKQKKYLCDYCGQTFDKDKMHEVKSRRLSSWRGYGWFDRYFMCDADYHNRLYKRD